VPMIAALVVAFVLWKWIRRRMFLRALRMARISPGELAMRLASGEAPLILDVREAMQRELTGWIPGALHLSTPEEALVPPHGEVIVYCDCPNELSAAVMARALMSRGFRNVRPLEGGFDAWFAQGHAIDGAP
jgi:rhodanese-related sulfurtransferase